MQQNNNGPLCFVIIFFILAATLGIEDFGAFQQPKWNLQGGHISEYSPYILHAVIPHL